MIATGAMAVSLSSVMSVPASLHPNVSARIIHMQRLDAVSQRCELVLPSM